MEEKVVSKAGKKELVESLAQRVGLPKNKSGEILDVILEEICTFITKEIPVVIPGFGRFYVVETKARKGKNPSTGESIDIPAKKRVRFKPGKDFSEIIMPPKFVRGIAKKKK